MLERRLVVSGARYFSWLAVRDEIRPSPDTPNSRLSALASAAPAIFGLLDRRQSGGWVRALLAAGWGALKERDLEGARRSFEAALLTGKHIADEAEAYEGLGWVAWWANDADARFPARERAYALYRQQGDPVAAARQAVWLGCDHHDFGGEHAVANGWYQRARVKPWFDVWLPDSKIEQYVGGVVPTLGVRDVGAGFVLIFPVKRSRITRPSFLVPDGDGNGWGVPVRHPDDVPAPRARPGLRR